jgi:hypothetical protein
MATPITLTTWVDHPPRRRVKFGDPTAYQGSRGCRGARAAYPEDSRATGRGRGRPRNFGHMRPPRVAVLRAGIPASPHHRWLA